MSYYVSAVQLGGSRHVLAVGPFRRHGDALAHVEPVRGWAQGKIKDWEWIAWGTCRLKTRHPIGKITNDYG